MPYFLTSEYKAYVDKTEADRAEKIDTTKKEEKITAGGVYKSQWLKDKLTYQNEKRRGDRKKPARDESKTEVGKKGKKQGESDEMLLDVIEELRSDLKVRDEEYEQQRSRLVFLEEQNTKLAQMIL